MKQFRWKAAVITFLGFIAFDVVLFLLDIRFPDNSVIIAISRVVLFPALPLVVVFPVSLSAGDDYTWDYVMSAALSLFSALVWSVLVGFFIRRRHAV
jgi:Mn2+/Fe2+ NRAMP family transporter